MGIDGKERKCLKEIKKLQVAKVGLWKMSPRKWRKSRRKGIKE